MYQIKTGMSTAQGDFQARESYNNRQDPSRSALILACSHAQRAVSSVS
jgi:hypothetical protein